MTSNRLVEIPVSYWPKLRDLYINRKHESVSYNLIQNYINWLEKDPSIDFAKFYSLNGDWSDGTFVFIEFDYYVMVNTQNVCQDRLLDAITCLDRNETHLFCGFPNRLKPTLEKYFALGNLKIDSSNLSSTLWFNVSPEDALKFDTKSPEGITLSELSQRDVETINSMWPHHHSGSEKLISRLIAYNQNIGAFEKDGNLIAWCLTVPNGNLGVLHVKDDYRHRGYANLLTRVLSRKLAKIGIDATAFVLDTNVASRNIFQKLGFKEVDEVHWLIKPGVGIL